MQNYKVAITGEYKDLIINKELYYKALYKADNYLSARFGKNNDTITLICGGGASYDHIAIDLFLNKEYDFKTNVTEIEIYLPCEFEKKFVNNDIFNILHTNFSKKIKYNTFNDFIKVKEKGGKIINSGSFDNRIKALCDNSELLLIFGQKGTIWNRTKFPKVYFNLNDLK